MGCDRLSFAYSPLIDIWCDGNPRIGFGHIRRARTLADRLTLDGATVRLRKYSPQRNSVFLKSTDDQRLPKISIFDTPENIDENLGLLKEKGVLTVALDYFGSVSPHINIAVFAHDTVRADYLSYVGFDYILIRDEIFTLRSKSLSSRSNQVLIMVGGGDLLRQSHEAARRLAKQGFEVTLIQGPFAGDQKHNDDYTVMHNPTNLPELLAGCGWLVASGGGSLFEGLCLGKAVHVLPQTSAEERIARYVESKGATLGVGLDSLRIYQESEIARVAKNGRNLIDGLGAKRISKIVGSLL
jgi:spore coat polysaccharide biosynthesis predicted glycosyltransferase SpsG